MKYEVTLTLRPVLYKFDPQSQFDKLYEFLLAYSKKYNMSLIAELTCENNVHYHGIVDLKDFSIRADFINGLRCMHKWLGRKTINQVLYEDSYCHYMVKHVTLTRQLILNPIVFDGMNVCKDEFRC